MRWWPLYAALVTFLETNVLAQPHHMSQEGYRLDHDPSYLILAPKVVRPNMVYTVAVSVFRLYHPRLHVQASVSSRDTEHASFSTVFEQPSTRNLQMLLPEFLNPGNYTFRVQGSPHGVGSPMGNVFYNETQLIFHGKYVSTFIQMHKAMYKQGQTVKFRIVVVDPHLISWKQTISTIYVIDPTGTAVRRWMDRQTNQGILELEFRLSEQPRYGEWKIQVVSWGHTYEKTFPVEQFYMPRFYVNVSMPTHMMDNEFALAGLVTANYTSGARVMGNARIRLEVRPALKNIPANHDGKFLSIEREIAYFDGRRDFLFPLSEIRELYGRDIRDIELHVTATVHNWILELNETGYSICVVYGKGVDVILLGDQSRTFKPGYPVTLYFAVQEADGTPLSGMRRQVTVTRSISHLAEAIDTKQDKVIVPDNGIIKYTFVPDKDAITIRVQANYDYLGLGHISKEAFYTRVYTTHDQYLHISTSTVQPEVDHYMVFTVRANVHVQTIYYLIMSGGNIILGNQLTMSGYQKTFSVALSRDMVPSAHIVVYMLNFGEVVADVLHFFVNGTYSNPVEVDIVTAEDFSRDTVTLECKTDPSAMIAFGGIDYDLYRYGGRTFITESELVNDMLSYDRFSNQSFSHLWYTGDGEYTRVFFPSDSYAPDANTTFSYTGLFVFSDANVTRLPHHCNESLGMLPCNSGRCYPVSERCDGPNQCDDGADELGCPTQEEDPFTPMLQRFKRLPPHYETLDDFLWWSTWNKYYGIVDIQVKVPMTPITWVYSALSMGLTTGLGIQRIPARYTATRFFYAVVEGPHNLVKGEQLGMRVALFNYWDDYLEALVTLHGSDEYRSVVVEDGYAHSYDPRLSSGDVQTMVYLRAGQTREIYMPVLPVVYNRQVNISISVISFLGNQTIVHPVTVKYNGVTNRYHIPYFIDLINQGSIMVPDFSIPVPEQFVVSRRRWHIYVQGSARLRLGLIGDMLGPGFYRPHLNAENWMEMPYGGAEQAIFNYALNLYYLQYLKITNQLRGEVLKNGLDYMNEEMQRILSYMDETTDAFSMFRDYRRSQPSIWLTSLALETFANSRVAEWVKDLYTPADLLNRIAGWLCDQQDTSQGPNYGSFYEDKSPLYDMKFGDDGAHAGDYNSDADEIDLQDAFLNWEEANIITPQGESDQLFGRWNPNAPWDTEEPPTWDEQGETNQTVYFDNFSQEEYRRVSMTAYVLIALAQAKVTSGSSQIAVSVSRVNALIYLEPRVPRITDPYQMALVAYALTLAGSNAMDEAFERLGTMKRQTAYMYWSRQEIPDNPTEIVNAVPFLRSRIVYANEGRAVEATSYALMVYMRQNRANDSLVIMKWLQTMRNTFGGFASTRDSLVALQALSQYCKNDESRPIYNIHVEVDFTADSDPESTQFIHLNNSNWQDFHLIESPQDFVYGQVKTTIIGTGQGLLQLRTEVNVEYPWLQQPATVGPFFNLTYVHIKFTGRNFSIMNMRPCVAWNRPDIRIKTGMVVLHVDLPTGYNVMNDDLRDYVRSGAVPNLGRAFFKDGTIRFYFDYLVAYRYTCVDFRADRWYPSANMTIQHLYKVYDFYEPGMHNTSLYTTYGLFTLNVCRACASFQCPYCPSYNLSPLAVPSLGCLVTSLLVLMTYYRYIRT